MIISPLPPPSPPLLLFLYNLSLSDAPLQSTLLPSLSPSPSFRFKFILPITSSSFPHTPPDLRYPAIIPLTILPTDPTWLLSPLSQWREHWTHVQPPLAWNVAWALSIDSLLWRAKLLCSTVSREELPEMWNLERYWHILFVIPKAEHSRIECISRQRLSDPT